MDWGEQSEPRNSGMIVRLVALGFAALTLTHAGLAASEQEIKHHYRSAVGQSGIFAGDGGFDIEVQGNTELIGAAITSTQEAIDEDRNRLTTASLTSSDLDNLQQTQSSGSSVGIGFGSDASALTTLAHNATANLLANLDAQAGLPEEQNQHSQTQSVISPARITITGTGDEEIDERSRQTADELTSRDPGTANQTLENSLTLQQAQVLEEKLREARENRAAGRIVGEVLSGIVGDIAQSQGWADGSPQKLALHGLVGLISAQVGDGNLVAGALAGIAQEKLASELSAYLKENGFDYTASGLSDEERSRLKGEHDSLVQLGMTLTGTAVGAIVGGTNGAAMGATAAYLGTTNNYLTHEQKNARDKALAQCKTESECQRIREAYQELSDRQDQIAAQAIEAARNCVGMVECAYAQSQLEAIGKEIFDAKTPDGEISQEMRVRWAMSGAALQEVEARYNSAECDLSTACANARTAGTLAAGGMVAGSAYKLISLCLTQPVTCNSIGINLAELAAGDALPVGLGITAATTAVKTADKITEAASAAKGEVNVVKGALPNAENAVIDANKITGYALDFAHPVGGNKAVVFDLALGYNQSNTGELIAKVQEGVRTNPATLGKADQFGQRFTVDMPITGPNSNTVMVRTGWIFDPGSTIPRLTTIYVK